MFYSDKKCFLTTPKSRTGADPTLSGILLKAPPYGAEFPIPKPPPKLNFPPRGSSYSESIEMFH